MTDDIVTRLRIAAGQVKGLKWNPAKGHEGDWYTEAADEIERLRAENSELRNGANLWATMFITKTADLNRWREIATELHKWLLPDFEDDEIHDAGVKAMDDYEKAVRGE